MDLTLVIPCFNEADRVEGCLAEALAHLDATGVRGEILVVDDGSTDGTAARARAVAARRDEVRVLSSPTNRGKGAAVREGVLAARGDVIVFLDADLSVGVDHVARVLGPLRNGVDVAVGCRHIEGAAVARPQGLLRRVLGRGYLGLARRVLDLPVADVTCGFKGFKRDVALDLFRGARCARWGFDAEVLHLASRAGYEIAEVPVTWRDGAGSAVRLPWDALRSLRELVAVRWRAARGAYHVQGPRRHDRA